MKTGNPILTSSLKRMSVSPFRETQVLLELAGFRFLTQRHVDDCLFGGSTLRPLSRQVIVRRVLVRLNRRGLVLQAPCTGGGPVAGAARLAYFLTAAGYSRARALNPGLPAGRTGIRGTTLMGHGLMCADVALAFRRAARTHPGHQLVDWECDWQAAERLGSTVVVPDAHLVYLIGQCEIHAFIEVDLATEGSRVFARKIDRYLDLCRSREWQTHLPVWPIVLTVAPNASRAGALRRVTATLLEAQHDSERIAKLVAFAFTSLDELLGQDGPFGAIWQFAGRSGRQPMFRPVEGEEAS